MLKYLASIWACRYFWLSLVKNDLQLRYRRSFLGIGWSLLQPLATTVVTCAVFHAIFHMNVRDHGLFILSGLACWSYFTSVTIQGCQSYVQAVSYIRQQPMPMGIYALRTTLGAMFHLLIALVLDGALPTLRCYAAATAITLILTALAALTLRYQQRRVLLYL